MNGSLAAETSRYSFEIDLADYLVEQGRAGGTAGDALKLHRDCRCAHRTRRVQQNLRMQ